MADQPKVSSAELARLNHDLLRGNNAQRAAAADRLAEIKSAIPVDFKHHVNDRLWRRIGPLGGDLMASSGNEPRNNVPTATLTVKGTSEYVEVFMGCRSTMIGVEIEVGGLTFAFYVHKHGYRMDEHGVWTSTVNLRGIWDILNFYQIWPVWWMPLAFQPFSHAIFIGPLVTVIENMISECALRIQSGIWEFVNNALSLNPDLRAYFGTLLQSNGNIFQMLKTPLYVVRTNPFLDSSPLYAKTVRMESCGSVITDITRPYGVDVRVDLWRPGMPQPDPWANLNQPTYVVTVKDRSQVQGPTGTIIDSVLRTAVDLQGSFFGNQLAPIIGPASPWAPEGVYVAPALGLNFVRPLVVVVAPRAGEKRPRSPLMSCEIYDHTPMGWQHIIGGKSPRWLNSLINALLAWLIDSLMIIIGISGIPGDLLSGFLNDSLLAFQLIQLYGRRSEVGPYHPGVETFVPTNSAPYNIEALFAFINSIWDSRGYTSAQLVVRHGPVIALGRELARGGLFSLIYAAPTGSWKIFTDYVENVIWNIDPTKRDIFIQIGDGKAEEAPLARFQRLITGLQESLNVVTITPSQ